MLMGYAAQSSSSIDIQEVVRVAKWVGIPVDSDTGSPTEYYSSVEVRTPKPYFPFVFPGHLTIVSVHADLADARIRSRAKHNRGAHTTSI